MSLKKNFFCLNTLKQLDAFAKPLEEVQIKTVWGGIVSLICFLTIGYLMISNIIEFFDDNPTEELFVDISRNKKLQINFDIIFPKISCSILTLDAVDNTDEMQLHVDHNIYKKRLDMEGNPISIPEKSNSIGNINIINSTNTTDCKSCYGAESSDIQCCNTCEDVKKAYKYKNWVFNPSNIEQCKGNLSEIKETPNEGCQMYGTLLVNRVSGNFHIFPGISYSISGMHVHDVQSYNLLELNTTHIIKHLSFGQKLESIPSKSVNPLDSTESIANEEKTTMFQYYIKVVPTMYQKRDNTIILTNQFSITKHNKVYDKHNSGIPGVSFNYEFSPIMIKFTERPRLLGHLITQFLSIISGVFICFWITHILMYKVNKLYHIRTKHLPDNTK